jgi:endogenous inhibitor of DNA gyrase (YacG/DUF329 family)
MKETKICPVCKKPVENSRGKYHPECRSRRAARVLFTCPVCGTVKEVLASKAKHMKYCSDECKYSVCNKKEQTFNIPKEEIERLYFGENKSVQEIADIYHTTKTTIFKKFKLHGIKTRSVSEGRSVFLTEHPDQNPFTWDYVKEKIEPSRHTPRSRERKRVSAIRVKKNKTKEEMAVWNQHISETMRNKTPQQKYDALMKQFAAKKKNGTFTNSKLEDRYAKRLDEQGIQYERQFIIPDGDRFYRYDFKLADGTLVEIQGSGTHADPRIYKADDIVRLGLKGWKPRKASEIWEEDKRKKEFAEAHGFEVEIVWEKEI